MSFAGWLIRELRLAGFRVRTDGASVLVGPGRLVEPADRELVARHRAEMIELLAAERTASELTPSDRDFLGRAF